MNCPLLDGPKVLIVCPELASYIGLNESIFLRQLHFILTQNDTVGKVADGRKWYRDKPIKFVEKHFPFWDEGVVKRAINNLRKDGLLLTRSDLNEIAKDRSLWYSIDYDEVSKLDGPVERITGKKAKRKAANIYSKSSADSQDDYTKEQNVLLTSEAPVGATKVQNVPRSKVQNVPTPKEVLIPKDSTTKTNSNELVSDKSPPPKPKTEISDHFLELTSLQMPQEKPEIKYYWSQVQVLLRIGNNEPAKVNSWLDQIVPYMHDEGLSIVGPQSVKNLCNQLSSGQPLGSSKNGNHSQSSTTGTAERKRSTLDDKPTFNPHTGETVSGVRRSGISTTRPTSK